LDLDGALKVVTNEVNHQIKDRVVHNKRYIDFEPVDETESNPILKMRGYKAKDANVFDDGVDVSK
jgi:Cdc6-like AAA superfamily ATPase